MTNRAVLLICLAAVIAAPSGCGGRAHAIPRRQPPSVTVITPQRADAVATITLPGDLVGFYQAALHAKVTGYLKSISVDKGDWVKAGQVLAEIEVPELQQRLQRARASLKIRRVTHERLQHVWNTDKRLVAREDVDVAQGKYDEAKAEVDELEAMADYTRIVAPFNGVITGRFVDPGALIEARGGKFESTETSMGGGTSAPLVTLADINKLRVYVYVPEDQVSHIRRGMPATITLHELPRRKFTGAVTRFAPSLDLATRTMLAEVDLDNPQHELYPGMYANVTLELIRHRNALELPPTAVVVSPEGNYLYLVRQNKLDRAPVGVGIRTADYVEITSGIAPGDVVVNNLSPALIEGETVVPVKMASTGPQAQQHPDPVPISPP